MPKQKMIDSHIHLWPAETCNEEGHTWMTPGNSLARPHLLEHYFSAARQNGTDASDVEVEGVVYVETDVRYERPSPDADVSIWAKGPLDEIGFLRKIVDGEYGDRDREILLGIVPWAPMDQPTPVLKEYLALAETRAGEECWKRIKGFRYLLQTISDAEAFERLVLGEHFINNLKELGMRGFSFDVGVDQRSGGAFQLELMAKAMRKAHDGVPEDQKVIFILNHLCKPAFVHPDASFDQWCRAIETMSTCSKTYMKLSGAFSELPDNFSKEVDTRLIEIALHLGPWIIKIMKFFGPQRVMFGSDWPVCNVRWPVEDGAWVAWKDILLMGPLHDASDEDRERVCRGTAREAYRL